MSEAAERAHALAERLAGAVRTAVHAHFGDDEEEQGVHDRWVKKVEAEVAAVLAEAEEGRITARRELARVATWIVGGYEPTAGELKEALERAGLNGPEDLMDALRDPEPDHPADHEWVSMENEVVTGGEMCLTCWQEGRPYVPIRAGPRAADLHRPLGEGDGA